MSWTVCLDNTAHDIRPGDIAACGTNSARLHAWTAYDHAGVIALCDDCRKVVRAENDGADP